MRSRILVRQQRGPRESEVKQYLTDKCGMTSANANFWLGRKDRPGRFTPGEIIEALILRKKWGTSGYKHARKCKSMCLPSITTLRERIAHFRVSTGHIDSAYKILCRHLEKENEPWKRLAVISYDEIAVSSEISYDEREDTMLRRSSKMQVLMIRGLTRNFKIPLFVDFNQRMTQDILKAAITKAERAGAVVISTVSDMASENTKLWSEMGVTYQEPWFTHPDDSSRLVFCLADPPHGIKLLRNHLLDQGFYLPDGVTKVTKKELEDLYMRDQGEFRMKYKLTSAHIDCTHSQRQRVRLATQLISKTVADALRLDGKEEYASFIQLFNDAFDVLNSRRKEDPKARLRSGYGGATLDEQNEVLERTYSCVTKMRGITNAGNKKKKMHPFQEGIAMCCRALPKMWKYIQDRYQGVEYVLTSRMNQDVLENFFSRYA